MIERQTKGAWEIPNSKLAEWWFCSFILPTAASVSGHRRRWFDCRRIGSRLRDRRLQSSPAYSRSANHCQRHPRLAVCRFNKIESNLDARRLLEPQLRVPVFSGEISGCGTESPPHLRNRPRCFYADFFCPALTFAHLARCAAAILFLPAADMVRLPSFDAIETTFCALTLAHRAFWARLMRLRAEADMVRLCRAPLREGERLFNPTKPRITSSNFSTRNCACLRSSRISWSAFSRFNIVTPSVFDSRLIVSEGSDLRYPARVVAPTSDARPS